MFDALSDSFTDGVSDGTPEENPGDPECAGTIVLFPGVTIRIHVAIISFVPFDKG